MHSADSAETPGELHGSFGPPKRDPQDDNGDARKRRGLGCLPAKSMLIRVSPWWMKFFFRCLCGEKRGRVLATLHFLRRVGIDEGGGVVSLPKNDSRYR